MATRYTHLTLAAALSALAAMPAVAENSCKGLSQSACDGSAQCSWVQGYTRKDGREVAAYCRIKPTGKSSALSDGRTKKPAG